MSRSAAAGMRVCVLLGSVSGERGQGRPLGVAIGGASRERGGMTRGRRVRGAARRARHASTRRHRIVCRKTCLSLLHMAMCKCVAPSLTVKQRPGRGAGTRPWAPRARRAWAQAPPWRRRARRAAARARGANLHAPRGRRQRGSGRIARTSRAPRPSPPAARRRSAAGPASWPRREAGRRAAAAAAILMATALQLLTRAVPAAATLHRPPNRRHTCRRRCGGQAAPTCHLHHCQRRVSAHQHRRRS